MKRPPAMARPARSTRMWTPEIEARKPVTPTGAPGAGRRAISTARSSADERHGEGRERHQSEVRTLPAGAGGEHGADGDADLNTSKHSVTTLSLPPISVLTSVGRIDNTTAPTSQNQDVIRPPIHSRRSTFQVGPASRTSRREVTRLIAGWGRPRRCRARSGAAIQQSTAKQRWQRLRLIVGAFGR